MKNNAFLMVGAPGSGKTTTATFYGALYGARVISADDAREELYGSASNQGEWSEVENLLEEKLIDCIGIPVVWDNTHCDRRNRRRQTEILRSYGYEVTAILVDTPLEVCLERNAKRDRVVPEHVVRRMHEKLQQNKHLLWREDFVEVITVDG